MSNDEYPYDYNQARTLLALGIPLIEEGYNGVILGIIPVCEDYVDVNYAPNEVNKGGYGVTYSEPTIALSRFKKHA